MNDNSIQEGRADGATASAPSLVVGIGASAGGIDACKRLLASAPADQGVAFVVILHLAPAQESHLAGIFGAVTPMRVSQVAGTQRLRPNHVYVIAPATSLAIHDGELTAGEPEEPHYRARPIDAFFASLAADRKERAVGIILSGTGDDGSAGFGAIREAGGLCLVQEPESAEYDGMPRSAVKTGMADGVVSPEEMGNIVRAYCAVPGVRPSAGLREERQSAEAPREGLDSILALVEQRYGLDFRNYKMGTLERRTERRMGFKRVAGRQEYVEYLREHPDEVEALYHDLLIEVTSFFRDPDEWDFLEQEVVPELLGDGRRHEPVRIWSAGCATGEEAYSLAMVFLAHLERIKGHPKLRVFASDVSLEALATARRGTYPRSIEDQVAPERLRRFFRRTEKGYEVERALRDSVTFAAHDLLSDPPFAHLDLVSCRNVLIYLRSHAQERLVEGFHFSLRPGGVLWLGGSETIGRRTELFEARSRAHRIYRSIGAASPGRHQVPTRTGAAGRQQFRPEGSEVRVGPNLGRVVEQFVLHRLTTACVVISRSLEILYFFGKTEDYLTRPHGEARMDLLSWVRPGLYARLRAALAEAVERQHALTITALYAERDATARRIEVSIEPVTTMRGAEGVFAVAFRDVSRSLDSENGAPEAGTREGTLVAQLERELDETRQELRVAVEQLKTANEEYHASHEELLSLNEEFQSSNEELETSKEELQSLNEELTTINSQLEERNSDLRFLNADLNNLLVSTEVPTVFLDRELRVRRFTPASTEVMRIVSTDVGRSLENIKLRVRDEHLLADAERALHAAEAMDAEVSTEDDRWFVRKALPYRTDEGAVDGVCLTFQDVTAQKRAAAASEGARLFAESIIKTSRTPLLVLDAELRVVSANRAFYETFGEKESAREGFRIYDVGDHQWDIPRFRGLLELVLSGQQEVRNYDLEHTFQDVGWRAMRLNANAMTREGRTALILVSIEDVTDLRQAEVAAKKRADELLEEHRRKDEFLAMLGHELRNPLGALANGLELLSVTGAPDDIERTRLMMVRQARRMTAMLDQLLDVARVTSGKFELAEDAVDLVEVVRSALETLQPMIDRGAYQLSVSLPRKQTAVVLGDAVRLAQVVENLLGNAVKYTEKGGRIWLAVETTADTVKLSVRDTGVGMDEALQAHAFEPFTQARGSLHRARGGLGLGLAVVRALVHLHRGDVTARSAGPGQGSEFVVTLPLLHSAEIMRPQRERKRRSSRLRAASRVLVVDDEADAAQMLVEILNIQGHDARAAYDGEAALELARTFHPEVVLLDLGLPKMDGYQVAGKLREEHQEPMFLVAMTGYQRDADRLEEAGFDDHLLKPVDFDKLTALLAGRDSDHRELSATRQET